MRLTSEDIFYLNALNSASGANGRDCVVQGNVIAFLVKKDELGRAIGKNAEAVKKLRATLKKNVEIFEHCDDAKEFIKSALYDANVKAVEIVEKQGKKQALVSVDPENKRKLLNSLPRIKRIKALLERNYKIEDIKIR